MMATAKFPKNDRIISVRFQGKPFNITVIQAYAPTSNAEEAEVEQFYEDLQDLLELTHTHTPHTVPLQLHCMLSLGTVRGQGLQPQGPRTPGQVWSPWPGPEPLGRGTPPTCISPRNPSKTSVLGRPPPDLLG